MNRNLCNLYISNISHLTTEDCLIALFSQFGKIESYTFFPQSLQRLHSAAIITYGSTVDVNEIIEYHQRMVLNGHSLFLRRTLPFTRPTFECVMSSNELLVSLDSISNDQEFNEKNLRNYFGKYGSIVLCRILIVQTTFLIYFLKMHSVDAAILDEPHFYNDRELILRKYVSLDRFESFHSRGIVCDEENRLNRFPLAEKVRRYRDFIEAFRFGYRVQLKLIERSYQEKIEKLVDMMKSIERMKGQNRSLKLRIEENQRMGKSIGDLYEIQIENEQNRADELRQAIDLLTFYEGN